MYRAQWFEFMISVHDSKTARHFRYIKNLDLIDFIGNTNHILDDHILSLTEKESNKDVYNNITTIIDRDHCGSHSPFVRLDQNCTSIYAGRGVFETRPSSNNRREKVFYFYNKDANYYNPKNMTGVTLNLFGMYIYVYVYII